MGIGARIERGGRARKKRVLLLCREILPEESYALSECELAANRIVAEFSGVT
jgi:hypothetical protein